MAETPEFKQIIERRKQGSLKVYLGYAAGVGKTYEMLQEGQRLKSSGLDVVIGYVEPHARPDTIALLSGLEAVKPLQFDRGGRLFPEMDVNAIIRRAPEIALVDELAHSNVAGAKHEKRYQDVFEILEQGINVITTLNVQHLESVAEKVTIASRTSVQERIPDRLLRRADQIVLVDVTMEELRERIRKGKIYDRSRIDQALQNFFTYENLSFLREMALREVAGDQLRKIETQGLLSQDANDLAQEAVMVAVSSDPSHAEILLRKATKLAVQLSTRCYAVYIQKSNESPTHIDSDLQRKLQKNLKLANDLGAEIVTIKADNVVEALVSFATTHHVRHAVFGKSRRSPLMDRVRGSLVMEFIHDSVGIDVHVVTTGGGER